MDGTDCKVTSAMLRQARCDCAAWVMLGTDGESSYGWAGAVGI